MELLKISNLCVDYGRKSVLSNINLTIDSGEVLSIAGDNGSGKTTLFKAIINDLPDGASISGEIIYENKSLLEQKDIQWFKRSIAYVPQDDSFSCDTPFEEVSYSYKLHTNKVDNDYVDRVFREFCLEGIKNKRLITKNGSQLSGGEKKMVTLLSALCRKDAKLFLIDEPLNNLDAKNVRTINNIISKIHNEYPNAAIIIITHCHSLAAITSQFEIKDGKLFRIENEYKCFNCFGETDFKGYYKVR